MLLIFFNLAVCTVFLLICVFNKSVYDAFAPWKMKNDERLVLSFHFVSFVLNVIAFVYNGLKQSHILQTMPNHLLQIYFFHRNLIYVYLKNSIFALCEETWVWVCHYVSHIGLHLLFCISEIYINLTRDLFLVSRGKKSWQSLYMWVQSFHFIWNWQNYT